MISAELLGAFRRHPLWSAAPETTLRQLLASVALRPFQPKDLLLKPGGPADKVFVLLDGAVRVFFADSIGSRELTVKLFWAPAVFGEAECALGTNWVEWVEALTPGTVGCFPAQHYFRTMSTDASTVFRHYWDLAQRFGISIAVGSSLSIEDLRHRAIALFVAYANHFGKRTADGKVIIDYPLTQEGLARELGSNRRSMVRLLTVFYKEGWLKRVGRKYLIPDVNALLQSARPPPLSYQVGSKHSS